MQPAGLLPAEFITDCAVWNLFHNSNHTVALRDVAYDGRSWQVANHFFPWLLAELRTWEVADSDIAMQLPTAQDRFVANWLAARAMSVEAQAVLDAGRAIWQTYLAQLGQLRTGKFRIDTWDAGWWQLRSALKDRDVGEDTMVALKAAHDALRDKLRPQLPAYGFLDASLLPPQAENVEESIMVEEA
jgi:hypothetical protein